MPRPLPHVVWIAAVVILVSHVLIDVYAAVVPAILGVLEVRCRLDPWQTAWLPGIGAFFSGMSQPIFAWLSDHFDTRLFAGLGLLLAAVGFCLIGEAENWSRLLLLYIVATIGVGMYHPIAASTFGHLHRDRRTLGVSLFFLAGMAGGTIGSFGAPRLIASPLGFDGLIWLMIPGVLLAFCLQSSLAGIEHRHRVAELPLHRPAGSWSTVGLLFVGAVLRFAVNLSLLYLFMRWVQHQLQSENPAWEPQLIANASAPYVGTLNAWTVAGMALGGMTAGTLIRSGRERGPLIWIPLLFAPVIALIPWVSLRSAYALALLSGVGFAALVPVTIGVAQRLLPRQTSLASALMLGGAWSLAAVGPPLAEGVVFFWGVPAAFGMTAVLLALSGVLALPIRPSALVPPPQNWQGGWRRGNDRLS